MATLDLTDEQIRSRGLEALQRELGPAGLIRFLRLFSLGEGDYSKERHGWLDGLSVEALVEDLRESHPPR